MIRGWIARVAMVVLAAGMAQGACDGNAPSPGAAGAPDANSVDAILEQLKGKAEQLKSYQCNIEYLFSQPLLESKTLRKGVLYYERFGNKSKLRINFETLKQEDEPQQKYAESYIFDGEWLTHIDYQIKQVQKRQLAEANEPIDAFELASRNFPMIGFSKVQDFRSEFEITLVEKQQSQRKRAIQLHLVTKASSQYAEQYKSFDFWIDGGTGLPARIDAISTEGDNYEIRLLAAKANEAVAEKVFEFEVPAGFGEPEVIPLRK